MSNVITLSKPEPRNLFLSQQVTQESINKISSDIIKINESDRILKRDYKIHGLKYKPEPIKLYVDSYGGLVYQCMGLLGIMATSKTEIHTIVTGCAMSCGFLISISAHKRFGYENSTYLYHQVSSGASGTVTDMEEKLEEGKRLQSLVEKITLKQTNISEETLKKILKQKKDWYIDSKEALELGIIDKLIV